MATSISWLLEIFKDSTGHWNWPWIGAALLAAGGGIVTVIGGIWAVFKFFAERKKADEKKGGDTNVSVGQGFGTVRDQTFQAPVNFGPSPELVAQIQKPLADELAAQRTQIENLTKMLLEKNPAAAGPGAQEAVGEAVQSITQGAAEGDSRLQQALALLEANKIAEAEPLLKAFAEDKTVRAEQDRKEAAIAYRNLGAIAGLRDPKAARAAYARAAALDPENAEGLFWDGWFQLDAKNLAAAEKSYRALIQLAGKVTDENEIFWARSGLGDIALARGDLNAALAAYDEARSEMARLAKSDPGNADWQRDLSASYNKLGNVQVAQGNLAGALKSYYDSLAIRDRLTKSDPSNAEWQRDLSVSYDKVGDVQVVQGDLAGALKSYSDSLAIADRLAQSDPGNADWQRDLSVSYNKVGDVQKAQGDLAGALKSFADSLAIRDRLAKSDPDNAEWQRDRSFSFGRLALTHRQSGDKAKALNYLRQGQEIMARLTKLSPDNAVWKDDLSWFEGQIKELGP
ncbi:MAG: tetratricopeptide repeat protein [Methylocella sp.]